MDGVALLAIIAAVCAATAFARHRQLAKAARRHPSNEPWSCPCEVPHPDGLGECMVCRLRVLP